jgi:putative Ca2+/H+ antiporter (TMEM165/GDT1 family)
MDTFLVSAAVVALGEIGDKTQLLALVLAARFRKPWPIIAGILVSTLANHALAGYVGNLVRGLVPADVLRWLVALSFFAVAAWALKPDTLDEGSAPPVSRWGVFGVTVVAFFLAEMGDKTQVATIVLAAKFPSLAAVVLGTTFSARSRRRASRSMRFASLPPCCSRDSACMRSRRRMSDEAPSSGRCAYRFDWRSLAGCTLDDPGNSRPLFSHASVPLRILRTRQSGRLQVLQRMRVATASRALRAVRRGERRARADVLSVRRRIAATNARSE